MLQVELMLCVTRGTLILPAGLPGYEASSDLKDMNVGIGACVVATVPEIQLQLRLHDYYMGKPAFFTWNKDTAISSISRNVTQRRRNLRRHRR